jgi:hypothetical protein
MAKLALFVFRGLKMDGSAAGTAAAHDELGRFRAGNSEYRARKQRLAEIVRTLAAEFDPTPSQVRLLPIIARHMDDAERARTAERRIRASNTVRRLMRDLKRKPAPAPYPLETARELLERLKP